MWRRAPPAPAAAPIAPIRGDSSEHTPRAPTPTLPRLTAREGARSAPSYSLPCVLRGGGQGWGHAAQTARSHLRQDLFLDLADLGFVAPIKGPLLDPLGPNEPGPRQHLQMLAGGRLAHSQLLGDEHAADAVLDQIAVLLRAEVPLWLLQPLQDLEAALIGESADGIDVRHIANLLIGRLMSSAEVKGEFEDDVGGEPGHAGADRRDREADPPLYQEDADHRRRRGRLRPRVRSAHHEARAVPACRVVQGARRLHQSPVAQGAGV